jgi:hypothetical protein
MKKNSYEPHIYKNNLISFLSTHGGSLRSEAAVVDVRLDVVPLQLSAQFFLADCGGLSVGWVSCWT